MTNIIPIPLWQIISQDGYPIVNASVSTYVVGTLTIKATYQDAAQTTQNTVPLYTDARGCTPAMWGSGDYRVVVRDENDVLLFDQVTRTGLPESSVSAAMLPVLGAETLSQARTLMGVDDEIQSMLNAAIGQAIATEAAARAAADAAEAAARAAADTGINTALAAVNAQMNASDASLQSQIDALSGTVSGLGTSGNVLTIKTGTARTDDWGNLIIDYGAFPHALHEFTISTTDPDAVPNAVFFNPNWWNLGLGIFTAATQSNGQAVGSAAFNNSDTGTTDTIPNIDITYVAIGY
jgi:hypothetical protein